MNTLRKVKSLFNGKFSYSVYIKKGIYRLHNTKRHVYNCAFIISITSLIKLTAQLF